MGDPIGFDADARQSWAAWLYSFEKTVYPTFATYGFGRNTALQAFLLNQLINSLTTTE